MSALSPTHDSFLRLRREIPSGFGMHGFNTAAAQRVEADQKRRVRFRSRARFRYMTCRHRREERRKKKCMELRRESTV